MAGVGPTDAVAAEDDNLAYVGQYVGLAVDDDYSGVCWMAGD